MQKPREITEINVQSQLPAGRLYQGMFVIMRNGGRAVIEKIEDREDTVVFYLAYSHEVFRLFLDKDALVTVENTAYKMEEK